MVDCMVGKWAQKVCVCVFHIFHICIWEKYLRISISMWIYIYMYTYTIFLFYKCARKTLLPMIFIPFTHTIFINFSLCPDHIYLYHFCIYYIFIAGATVKGRLLFVFFKTSVQFHAKGTPPKISTILTLRSLLFAFLVFVFIFQTPQYLWSLHIYIYSSQCELFIYYKQSSIHNMAQDMKTSGEKKKSIHKCVKHWLK